jgi:hypothetical protein
MQERWGQRRSPVAAVKHGGENTWTMSDVGFFDVMIAVCERGRLRDIGLADREIGARDAHSVGLDTVEPWWLQPCGCTLCVIECEQRNGCVRHHCWMQHYFRK